MATDYDAPRKNDDDSESIEALKERYGRDMRIEKALVNPTAGSHCGPNGVGISFHAIHR